jgi:hypothetical protein
LDSRIRTRTNATNIAAIQSSMARVQSARNKVRVSTEFEPVPDGEASDTIGNGGLHAIEEEEAAEKDERDGERRSR